MFLATPAHKPARAPRGARILAQIAITVFTLLACATVFGQGVKYSVAIEGPRPLQKLLEENLDLLRWQGNPAPVERIARIAVAEKFGFRRLPTP